MTTTPGEATTPTATDERIAAAPLPTTATLRRRGSLPVQAVRFAAINLRMLRVIVKGH